MGPEILSSIGVGVWRKAPEAFPDSDATLDTCQSPTYSGAENTITTTRTVLFERDSKWNHARFLELHCTIQELLAHGKLPNRKFRLTPQGPLQKGPLYTKSATGFDIAAFQVALSVTLTDRSVRQRSSHLFACWFEGTSNKMLERGCQK